MSRRLAIYLGAIVVGLLTGLFSQAAAEAHAISGQPVAIYTYDWPYVPEVDVAETSERGPPMSHPDVQLHQADPQGAFGPSARLAHATTYDYDAYPEPALTHSARIYDRKMRMSGVDTVEAADLSLQPSRVAANGGRLLAKADRIEAHLARPEIGFAAKNDAMLARIRSAAAEGTPLSRADRAFMRHELTENWLMNRGMGIDLAHRISGWTHRTYGNFDPSVIKQLPQEFNSNWRRFWDIE